MGFVSETLLPMFIVYVVYVVAVKHLVVTAQDETAGIDSKVLTN